MNVRWTCTGTITPRRHLATTAATETLRPASVEQARAVHLFCTTRHNLIVDACAGSGKTTTILHLAAKAPEQTFLVLVYNRRLMIETTERVRSLGLGNITVTNYHTCGSTYYTAECSTDQGLKRVVEEDMRVIEGKVLPRFDVVVMDEQQDMTPIMKQFVDKVFRDMGVMEEGAKRLRVIVLGDKRQEMYGFNNSDSRFLGMSSHPEVFGYLNDEPWEIIDQPTSNRLTHQNVEFINQHMLKPPFGKKMFAARKNDADGSLYPRPRYVICNTSKDAITEVIRLLEEVGVPPAEMILLAPSVRFKAAVVLVANMLAFKGYPVHVANSDIAQVSPEVARGKILVCSYHQSKGIEREAALVFGFDNSYHTYYNRLPEPPRSASNPQYVAATRAKRHLVLLHDHTAAPLPFVDMDTLEETCDVIRHRDLMPKQIDGDGNKSTPRFSVTTLTRNLPENLITECIQLLNFISIAPPMYGPNPAVDIEDVHGLRESVSNITGTAAPAIFELHSRNTCTALRGALSFIEKYKTAASKVANDNPLHQLPSAHYARLKTIESKSKHQTLDDKDILYLANFSLAAQDLLIVQLLSVPIDGYSWLTKNDAADIFFTLKEHIPARGVRYERNIQHFFPDIEYGGAPDTTNGGRGVYVRGCTDISRTNTAPHTVWEIKYTTTLQAEHILQVSLYAAIMSANRQPDEGPVKCYLLSAQTGQMVEIRPKTSTSYLDLLQKLVAAKSGGYQPRLLNSFKDDEFLEECRGGFRNLIGPVVLPVWFNQLPSGHKMWHRSKKSKMMKKAKKAPALPNRRL
ncbi:P-loop containing nucleoside triphosphate hydrolase protein [Lyophyllum atratum]|nr:P-loop containing nucleoside triphosphate hydrolase protein [Lyophyllum atratum]